MSQRTPCDQPLLKITSGLAPCEGHSWEDMGDDCLGFGAALAYVQVWGCTKCGAVMKCLEPGRYPETDVKS